MRLTDLTITEAATLISQRKISPLDLTMAYLERIERIEPLLNTFITVTAETAIDQARKAEEAIIKGTYLGPLHGIPLAIKDVFETKGIRTTAGSKFLANYLPQSDCAVVERLSSSGTVLLGKLNMHEWALGVTNNNPFFGACRNPWALDRIPGGSSGGSGAALAAELCLGSIGTDTGGSIRVPSALCGVVGLKPTYGRVSLRGVIPVSWTLDHAGPIARRVGDVALLLQNIAGFDPDDPSSLCFPTENYSANLECGVDKWRIALAKGGMFAGLDSEVLEAVNSATQVYESLGAKVEVVEITTPISGGITSTDAAAFHRQRLQERPEDFGSDVIQLLRAGASRDSIDYSAARRTQMIIRRQFEVFFETYDILLTPTTPIAAPPLGKTDPVEMSRNLTKFTGVFNLAGVPALSLACGFTSDGLPIGLQIVGRHWGEAQVLRAAHAYEKATNWYLRKPIL